MKTQNVFRKKNTRNNFVFVFDRTMYKQITVKTDLKLSVFELSEPIHTFTKSF